MVTRQDLYHGTQTNLIVPLGLYNEHQILCSQRGLDKEIGMIMAGYEINPRNFVFTDFQETVGERSSGSIVCDSRIVAPKVILPLLQRTTRWDRICGLDGEITDWLHAEEDMYAKIVRGKKVLGSSHTHPTGYGTDLSTIDKDKMREYITFARKYPQIHAANHGNIEWVVEPHHEPSQNENKLHAVKSSGIEGINLVIIPDIENLLRTEFGM